MMMPLKAWLFSPRSRMHCLILRTIARPAHLHNLLSVLHNEVDTTKLAACRLHSVYAKPIRLLVAADTVNCARFVSPGEYQNNDSSVAHRLPARNHLATDRLGKQALQPRRRSVGNRRLASERGSLISRNARSAGMLREFGKLGQNRKHWKTAEDGGGCKRGRQVRILPEFLASCRTEGRQLVCCNEPPKLPGASSKRLVFACMSRVLLQSPRTDLIA